MDIKYRIDEGKAYYEIAEDNLHHAKHHVYFEINNLYVAMKQLEKKIPLMEQKVIQTLENFELADGRYTVGLGNFIELQDAQTNYNTAQLDFVQTVFRYNVAREEFFKAMGVQ
jgi:outer membrane protein TolC